MVDVICSENRNTEKKQKTDADVAKHQFKKMYARLLKFATFQGKARVLIKYLSKSASIKGAQGVTLM